MNGPKRPRGRPMSVDVLRAVVSIHELKKGGMGTRAAVSYVADATGMDIRDLFRHIAKWEEELLIVDRLKGNAYCSGEDLNLLHAIIGNYGWKVDVDYSRPLSAWL